MANALTVPLGLFAFIGFVAVLPVWMWFLGNYTDGLPVETQFLAGLVLPATALFFLASWAQPGGG